MVVDAHAHCFERIQGQLGPGPVVGVGHGMVRIGDLQPIRLLPPVSTETTFTADMLLRSMDGAGVDRAVLLQGPFYGDLNDYVAEAVGRWPDRFTGSANIDPWAEGAGDVFRRCVEGLGLRVVKISLCDRFGLANLHPGARLDDPCAIWLWEEMERRNLVLTLDLGAIGSSSYQTEPVNRIATERPGLRIIVAHLSQPSKQADDAPDLAQAWEEQVCLARHSNVWLDLSALPAYAIGEEYPFSSVGRWIRRAIELVGTSKLMWGSDAPGLLTLCNYPQLLGCVKFHLDSLPGDERQAILGRNAVAAYGIETS